ncbi:NAD(P)-binding protein [Roridomyces roridus]|uniref:NAD(P)-binding protein n=1 Tax=Roridomyces roridus TaxID=1738132 RepID=A0AAD7FDN7_9AGAR|nr:NAD(P)-binding protein [Roridomyces roridus]
MHFSLLFLALLLPVVSFLALNISHRMPSLSTVRAFNARFTPSYGTPVAIFVGGTSGIGRGMAEAFARHTKGNAHIVLVGRNRAAGEAIIATFPKPTATGVKHEFVECDVSLMKNVGRTSAELLARFPKINFLALSTGVLTLNGRDETEEGIDRKLAVHYYGRWRFIRDLMPALKAAQKAGEDAKVISVLGAKHGGKIDLDDLGLKKHFSVLNAALAGPTYNDCMVKGFADRHPGLSFIHSYPGTVATDILRNSNTPALRWANSLTPLLKLFAYSFEDAGEHQLYALLNAVPGAKLTDDKGADYVLKQDYFDTDTVEKVWKHTEEVALV